MSWSQRASACEMIATDTWGRPWTVLLAQVRMNAGSSRSGYASLWRSFQADYFRAATVGGQLRGAAVLDGSRHISRV